MNKGVAPTRGKGQTNICSLSPTRERARGEWVAGTARPSNMSAPVNKPRRP